MIDSKIQVTAEVGVYWKAARLKDQNDSGSHGLELGNINRNSHIP